MALATCVTAAIGYGLVYAAMPNRATLRASAGRSILGLLTTGVAMFVWSTMLGAIAFGPVLGPTVALAAATAAGSVFVLVGPFLARDVVHRRSTASKHRAASTVATP